MKTSDQDSNRPSRDFIYALQIKLFGIISAVLFSALLYKLFTIQIIEYDRYEKMALNNRRQIIRIPAHRGEIFADDGNKQITVNKESFSIFLVPNSVPRIPEERACFIARVNKDFGIDTNHLDQIIKKGRWNPYRSHPLIESADITQITYLAEHNDIFPGLFYQFVPVRHYLAGELYAHITGYVRKITSEQLRALSPQGYHRDSILGVKGIEKQYDINMRGKDGYRYQIVDARNRVSGEINPLSGLPVPGNNIIITIDDRIQRIVCDMMQGYPGGAIVSKPATGEILALYSYPSFDPNIFIGKVDPETYNAYANNPDLPFFNRVIQGEYPPSSVFKTLVSIAAIADGDMHFTRDRYTCEGKLIIGPQQFKCEGWHGYVNMHQALVRSCNVYYYQAAMKIGPEKIIKYAKDYFNLGTLTGIDLPHERPGRVPSHRWKSETRGTFWWDGDTANLSIGQGYLLATVLQMHVMTSAVAHNGKTFVPHLLKRIESVATGKVIMEYTAPVLVEIPIEKSKLADVQKALRNVVLEKSGTAYRGARSKLQIAGKTGTAQNIQGQPHAWFSCYEPYNSSNPHDVLAVTVFVENGGHGGDVSAPFAAAILEAIRWGANPRITYKRIMQGRENKQHLYEKWLEKRKEQPLKDDFYKYLTGEEEEAVD